MPLTCSPVMVRKIEMATGNYKYQVLHFVFGVHQEGFVLLFVFKVYFIVVRTFNMRSIFIKFFNV